MGHVCPWWFAYTFDNPFRLIYHKPEKIFTPYVKKGMCVADIGCGLGYFSLGLARMVGETGKVIAVDLQPQMLNRMEKRAARVGLSEIIQPQQCRENDIDINEPLDFALAFWMVHEVPSPSILFKQLNKVLKPNGILLFTEPIFHVIHTDFQQEMTLARKAGFHVIDRPKVCWSRAAVLQKNSEDIKHHK